MNVSPQPDLAIDTAARSRYEGHLIALAGPEKAEISGKNTLTAEPAVPGRRNRGKGSLILMD